MEASRAEFYRSRMASRAEEQRWLWDRQDYSRYAVLLEGARSELNRKDLTPEQRKSLEDQARAYETNMVSIATQYRLSAPFYWWDGTPFRRDLDLLTPAELDHLIWYRKSLQERIMVLEQRLKQNELRLLRVEMSLGGEGPRADRITAGGSLGAGAPGAPFRDRLRALLSAGSGLDLADRAAQEGLIAERESVSRQMAQPNLTQDQRAALKGQIESLSQEIGLIGESRRMFAGNREAMAADPLPDRRLRLLTERDRLRTECREMERQLQALYREVQERGLGETLDASWVKERNLEIRKRFEALQKRELASPRRDR
jgi:hypothetical protein